MKKISFICAAKLDNFIDPIIVGLSNDYMVRKFIVKSEQEIYNAIDWSDIVWLEWANEVAVIGTKYEGIKGKKIIVRLHGYEVFSEMPKKINWAINVDRLILVATNVLNILKTDIPGIERKIKIEMLYNGMDINKFQLKIRKPGYNIAWVGFINYKKNPVMMLQIIQKLIKIDPRYKIHIAGTFQIRHYDLYLKYMMKELDLENNVIFYGQVDDMNSWLQDKSYLLSTSILEGYGYAIMEAMAQGIKPIIHNFYGAKDFYPKEYLFNTVDEAVEKITSEKYDSREYRDWIINNGYTLENQLKQIKGIIKAISK